MFKNIIMLVILMVTTLFAAPALEVFERFSKADGGPDTRGAIWYEDGNIFVADHKEGLWKIDECGLSHGQTTEEDKGLWDIWSSGDNLFSIGNDAMYIYDKNGNHLKTFSNVSGEGIYIQNGHAYIAHDSGITIVNIDDINNPIIVDTIMTGKEFSQIRGTDLGGDGKAIDGDAKLIYATTTDGELYLFKDDKKGNLTYQNNILLFSGKEARKLFISKDGLVYVNSNFGELAIVETTNVTFTMNIKDKWSSSEDHGSGSRGPAAGGVFVTEIDSKIYALITAADGNGDGYLYWLDVTDPTNIIHVDTLHDDVEDYGFNHIWLNDTKIYLAAHDGFSFMSMSGIRNTPVISIKDSDNVYKEDINVTQNAASIGETKTFYAKVENTHASDKLKTRLKAPASDGKWEYKYYNVDKNLDITEHITGSTGYELKILDPGESKEIKIEMTPITADASDAIVTITASNKDSKEVCGQALQSDDVTAVVTFKGAAPFTCSGNAYIFTSHSSKNNPTDVYVTDIVSGNFDLVKSDINPTNINAIGYNITDNYIWGYDKITEEVKRVDKNYNVTSYTIAGLPKNGYHAGDVSTDGILYLYTKFFDDGKKIYKVDVNPSSATYLKMVSEISLSEKLVTSDFAFHPDDNMIYFAGETNLFKIDTNTKIIHDLGSLGLSGSRIFVATFFDNDGYFYIQENEGTVYRIDITDPANPNPKAEDFSTFEVTSYSDGARCSKAPMIEPSPPVDLGCSTTFAGPLSSTKDEIKIGGGY